MPALTTIERVRLIDTELEKVSDARLELAIEDASLEVSSLSVPEEHHERLARYLAAHLAILSTASKQAVIREKVDVIERQYSDPNKNLGILGTKYGQEYQRILDELAELTKSPKKHLNLMVI
ncbi:DUF4054 domain-containing protein [Metasolibacillus sp.]|uniref:DUF4054 domain-containing protein n=1 Tax=Metasolibacillus sp. TaxID=2703680 RepID=UPI0025D01CC0|nr:DUF4054 domain-containing protein [Metasolibacillus sp.]MCT6926161.1 DUF4054 domain-containing protein [Metasolibacillus sp.]MCT6942406.1 DUF4054 domain-containing protein [Metasolibacillus sp.]